MQPDDAEAHSDLGIQPRRIETPRERVVSNLGGKMSPVGLSQQRGCGHRLGPNVLGAEPLPFGGDRLLQLGIGDLESVLDGQLDT